MEMGRMELGSAGIGEDGIGRDGVGEDGAHPGPCGFWIHEWLFLSVVSIFPLALLSENIINPPLCPKGPPGSGGLKGEAGEMGPQVSVELGGAGKRQGGAA